EFDITNTRSEDKSITITKDWKDTKETAERPESIEVELFRSVDGDEQATFVDTYTVKAENDWSLEIGELPAFDADGKAYTYESEEIEVDGYESTINSFDITNLRVGTTEVSGTKTWVDNDDKAEKRPESITVNLLANGEPVEGKSLEVTADDEWAYTFTDLDKFDENGAEITYTVDEDEVPEHYKKSNDESELNITNTLITYAIGDYVWINSNKDGLQDENEEILEGVKVELIDEDGKVIETTETDENGLYIFDELLAGDYQVKFTLTEEQEKKYKFTEYKVAEDTTEDSDAGDAGWTEVIKLNDDNSNLTKDYAPGFKATEGIDPTWDAGVIELTEVTVNKNWNDDNDATGDRPNSIKVNLKQNDTVIEEVEIEANDDGEWTHTFTGLTKYVEEGKEYDYTVSEQDVAGYTTSYDQDNYEITNTRSEEKSITIHKAWLDNDNATE